MCTSVRQICSQFSYSEILAHNDEDILISILILTSTDTKVTHLAHNDEEVKMRARTCYKGTFIYLFAETPDTYQNL